MYEYNYIKYYEITVNTNNISLNCLNNNNIIIDDIEDEFGVNINEVNLDEYEDENNDILDDEEEQEENEEH